MLRISSKEIFWREIFNLYSYSYAKRGNKHLKIKRLLAIYEALREERYMKPRVMDCELIRGTCDVKDHGGCTVVTIMIVGGLFRCEKVGIKWILIRKNFEKSPIALIWVANCSFAETLKNHAKKNLLWKPLLQKKLVFSFVALNTVFDARGAQNLVLV